MYPPTTCSCCGQLVTRDELRWDGTQEIPADSTGPGYFLEYRTHDTPDCGSTLGFERPWHDADARRDCEITTLAQAARREAEIARVDARRIDLAAMVLAVASAPFGGGR